MSNKAEQLPSLSLHCPTCGAPSRVRASRGLSNTTRELRMECGNIKCGAVFQAIVEATKIYAPSFLTPEEQMTPTIPLRLRSRRKSPPKVDPRQMFLVEVIDHPPDT